MDARSLRRQVLLSTTMLVGALTGYGSRAYGACVFAPPPNFFTCSGAFATSITIIANDATVSTVAAPAFSVNNAAGNALTITGAGDISYTDANASPLTAADMALNIQSTGDVGMTPGSVTVDTGGILTGDNFGIRALNSSSGALTVTANGDVTGATAGSFGIYARNSVAGTDLKVTTGAGKTVMGLSNGIRAVNNGSLALTVKAYGNVTGASTNGIQAQNNNGTDLTVTTGTGTTVTGGTRGIYSHNQGTGALTVKAYGNVTGTLAGSIGIQALNSAAGTTLTVTTGAGKTVMGLGYGIHARNNSTGALTVTANGDVTGTAGDGIYARSGGTAIAVTVGAASHVASTGAGVNDFALDIRGGPGNVTLTGTLNGGAGGAISFDQVAALNDQLTLDPSYAMNGNALGGPGSDNLTLRGTVAANFDVAKLMDFETGDKIGSGQWTLTGTNTQLTNFSVSGGLLSVNGSMANTAFAVNSGTLGGTGTVGNLTVLADAVFAPGNSIGTETVNGNLKLDPGAIYEVEVDAAGNGDKANVNGTVNLTGSILRVLAQNGAYNPSTSYLIIDNDAVDPVTGAFASVTSSLAFLTPTVIYNGGDGNDVVLTLVANPTFSSVARTPNERAVANALSQSDQNSALVQAILPLTAADARTAFDALSGEIHATVGGVLAGDSRYVREAVLGRLMQASYTNKASQVASLGMGGPQVASLDAQAMALGYDDKSLAPPAYGPGLAFWTRGYGAWGNFDGNLNAASADRNLGGFVSGVDARVGGTWRAGLGGGYSQSDISVDARHSSADVESFNLAGYTGGMAGPFALRGGGAWAWSNVDTSRAVIFPGLFEREKASYNADTGQLFGEAAYPMAMGSVALEPFAGIAFVDINTDSFKENGALAALSSRGVDENVGYSTLGLRAASTMHWGSAMVTPHVSAAWQHAFDDVNTSAALLFASTGIGFTATGVPLAEDTALIEAGLDLNLSPTATLGASYSGQFGDSVEDNAVKGRFTWLF